MVGKVRVSEKVVARIELLISYMEDPSVILLLIPFRGNIRFVYSLIDN